MVYVNKDVEELLTEIGKNVDLIYIQTRHQEIKKVVVKNTLENMRSVLDYIAQDVIQELSKLIEIKHTKIYFPYGQSEQMYYKSLRKNFFDQLVSIFPHIYQVFLKQQPFICNNPWLIDLCRLSVEAKHNNLLQHKRQIKVDVIQPGFIHMENCRNVSSYNNIAIDGSSNMSQLDDIFINDKGEVRTIRKSGTTIILEKNRLLFDGKNIEVKFFFGTCIDMLNSLYNDLQKSNWINN